MTLKQLRDRLHEVAQKMRAIHDAAEKEDRGLTADESSQWDACTKEHTDLEARVERAKTLETNGEYQQQDDRVEDQADRDAFDRRQRTRDEDPNRPLTEYERLRGINAWAMGCQLRESHAEDLRIAQRMGLNQRSSTLTLRWDHGRGPDGTRYGAPMTRQEVLEQRAGRAEYRAQQEQMDPERRDQSVGTTTAGGFTVPDEMMQAIEIAQLAFGGMREVSTVLTTATGADMPIPTSDDTSNEGAILAENIAAGEQDIVFGQLILQAFKYSSLMIPVSIELMQDSATNMAQFVGGRLFERLARIMHRHATVGTGTAQPNGVVSAATDSTVVAASNTAITYPEVLNLKHSVDPAYRNNARFMAPDGLLLLMKTMVDSQNRPLWLPSLIPGEPSTFDGDQVVVNQHMAAPASDSISLLYGDFSKYLWRETHEIEIMRLDERFAEQHQVAFLGFSRFDGDLLDAGTGPVKFLTMAT